MHSPTTQEIDASPFGVPQDECLAAQLGVHADLATMSGRRNVDVDTALVARFPELYGELKRRLEAEPGVSGVALSGMVPGGRHAIRWFQLDGPDDLPRYTATTPVGPDYLFVMTLICGAACAVPTGRALAIEPTEALKAE